MWRGPPPAPWAQACVRQWRPPARPASAGTRRVTGSKAIRPEMPAAELPVPSAFSHGLSQQRLDHFGADLANCPLHFMPVPVKNERRDVMGVELLQVCLVRVVIGFEDRDALEFRLFKKF